MSESGWARWRSAEDALARGVDTATAAAELPERQRWILRATAALERGQRDELEALLPTAPTAELRQVAELALSEPGEHDPTRFRASLKSAGVANAPLPRLDLLRLACVAHNRERASRPQKLADAARTRPVLGSALTVLSKQFTAYQVQDDLRALSPRLASFWGAGIGQLRAPGNVREFVRRAMPEVETLAEDAWPDLEQPIAPPGGVRQFGAEASLDDFLRDPVRRVWGARCMADASALATRGERALRERTLGRLLDAIHAVVREGAPPAALPLVEAAMWFVDRTEKLVHRDVLHNQLALLDLRLRWFSGELDEELLEPIWSGLQDRPPAERAAAARTMLTLAAGRPVPRAVRSELVAWATSGDVDWENDVLPWLEIYGEGIDLRAFQAALRSAPEATRERALGDLASLHGSPAEALRLASRLHARGERGAVRRIVVTAVGRAVADRPRGRQPQRFFHRALLDLAAAMAAEGPPPDATVLFVLAGAVALQRGAQEARELVDALTPIIGARLALPPAEGHVDQTERLRLLSLLDLDERARTEFRAFGRWLRSAPPQQAIPAALRMCAALCPDDEAVEDFLRHAGAGAGAAPPDDPSVVWLRSVTAWLEQVDDEAAARHAIELVHRGAAGASSLARWLLEVSIKAPSDAWDPLLALSDAEEEDDWDIDPDFLDGLANPF